MVWNIFSHILGTSSSQLTKSIIFQRGRSTTKQKICIALLNWVNLGWVVKWSTQQLFCFKVSEIAHVKTHEIHSMHLRTLEQCSNMFKLCWLMILRSCANVPNIFKISRIRYGNPYLPTSKMEWRCGFSNPSPVHNHHSSQVELRPSCHGPRRGELPWHNRETRGNRLYYIIVDLHGVSTYWLYMIMLYVYMQVYIYIVWFIMTCISMWSYAYTYKI